MTEAIDFTPREPLDDEADPGGRRKYPLPRPSPCAASARAIPSILRPDHPLDPAGHDTRRIGDGYPVTVHTVRVDRRPAAIRKRRTAWHLTFAKYAVAGFLLTLGACLALAVGMAVARAHGDAAWIMVEPRYRDADNVHCCGPTDCSAMPDGAVEETANGYLIKATGELIEWTAKGVYVSRDEHFWSCFRGGKTRCLFVPGRMG